MGLRIVSPWDFLCVNFCDADQLRQSEGLFPQFQQMLPSNKNLQPLATQWDALKFSITILCIRTPEHSILVDTGLGGNIGRSGGDRTQPH